MVDSYDRVQDSDQIRIRINYFSHESRLVALRCTDVRSLDDASADI